MKNVIIDFLTNNKIETAIVVITGLVTISGYIFNKKIRKIIKLFLKFFVKIISFVIPNGIIKIINTNNKMQTLRRKCLDKISYSISSKPIWGVMGVDVATGLISIENLDIFDKLQAIDLINFYNQNHYITKELLLVLERQINQGDFDEQIKKMKKEGDLV